MHEPSATAPTSAARTIEVKRVLQVGDRVRVVGHTSVGVVEAIEDDGVVILRWLHTQSTSYWSPEQLEVVGLAGEPIAPHEATLAAAARTRDEIAWEKKVIAAARAYRAAWLRANAGRADVSQDVPMQALALMSAIVL